MERLCFATNLSSADMAAWVQAVGTVLAVVVALGLALWQRWIELTRRRTDDLRKAKDAESTFATCAGELLAAIGEGATQIQRTASDGVRAQALVIEGWREWARNLPVNELPAGAIRPFLQLQAIAIEGQRRLQRVVDNSAIVNWSHELSVINRLRQDATHAAEAMNRAFTEHAIAMRSAAI